MKKWLTQEMGWPDPVMADSGNGYHALYRIDLPNDDESRDLLKAVLEATAAKFDNQAVKIDRKVYNASRIMKAYGSRACKGDNIPERPHRIAMMFAPPPTIHLAFFPGTAHGGCGANAKGRKEEGPQPKPAMKAGAGLPGWSKRD